MASCPRDPEGDGLGLWAWLCGRVDREGATGFTTHTPRPGADPQSGPRPPWHDPQQPNPYVSDDLLWIIEAAGCHVARLATEAVPAARWDVYKSRNRRDVNNGRTVLVDVPGGPANPSLMVYGAVIAHVIHGEAWKVDALGEAYRYVVEPLR